MTINKAQGQTLERVGVCLDTPCFSHGQLYVAASRVGHPDDLKFAVEPNAFGCFNTPNIVHKEALTTPHNNHNPPSACAFAWGAFDPDSGEHRTHHNDAGRCCAPVPLRVPHAIYVKMTPHELMMNAPVVCDEADAAWVGQEVQNRQEAEHSE